VIERLEAERAPEAGSDSATPQITNSGDLDRVLQETESTINRIVGEARRGAERELAEIEGRRDEVRAEVEALIAQRDRLAPLAENVRELLGEAQARTQDADTRIRTVLEPLAATVGALRGRLAELMDEAEREDEIEIVASEEEPAGSEDAPSAVIHLADGPRISRSPW
jgi:chromosome segregation ATPase